MGAGPNQPEHGPDAVAVDAAPAPQAQDEGVLERVTDEVSEQATRAVTFVGRLGSAFGEGLRDARDEHRP